MKSSRIDSPSSPRRRFGFGFSENHLPLPQIPLPERNLEPFDLSLQPFDSANLWGLTSLLGDFGGKIGSKMLRKQ
ncbi:hypothetical protein COLO4_12284 [Corchorus olitorius]|uniref:Uncharacterized protein n=1 Tax=Corchorus olitorius TaxID=93759 RepID=A0A1R3K1D6_9ROSI|nr:hypothetical protein COLO4_12284 [Corchorus olitorius]